jgi:hypothetical protein
MRARLLIGALLCGTALFMFVSATSAGADERPGGNGGAYVDPNGDPTAIAGDGGSGTGAGGGSAEPSTCRWLVLIDDDFAFGLYDTDLTRLHSQTGRWLQYVCPPRGAIEIDGRVLIPEGGLVDPQQLAINALASVSIQPPAIRTSPSASGRLFVQVPTWLWLERDWWQPYEATARAGRVWSTVRATPVATTWSLGDGRTVSCRGPGTEWRPGLPDDASNCTYTYRNSSAGSPGGTFNLEATVTFEVSWSTNAGGGGTLPAITRTSSLGVQVGEIQAIGTRGGQ